MFQPGLTTNITWVRTQTASPDSFVGPHLHQLITKQHKWNTSVWYSLWKHIFVGLNCNLSDDGSFLWIQLKDAPHKALKKTE